MSTNFSGLLSTFTQSYNSLDIMSQINYINQTGAGDFVGQIAVIVVGGLVFGWSNANSWMTLPSSAHLNYGTFSTGAASFPIVMATSPCAAIANTVSNSLLAINCLSGSGVTTIEIISPNGNVDVKFFFIGVALTSWIPSPTPNFSGFLSNFTGSSSPTDIMIKGALVPYTSVTGGGTFTGTVGTGRIGNFTIAFNTNGYLFFSSSNTLTVTIPVVFLSNVAFGFCSSVYPNILPNVTSVTTNASNTTFTLVCKNYESSYMQTNFIIVGQCAS